jgi:hypothetical protein
MAQMQSDEELIIQALQGQQVAKPYTRPYNVFHPMMPK